MAESDGKIFQDLTSRRQLDFLATVRDRLPQSEWYLVGGAVRDALLGRTGEVKDLDLVVRGVGPDELLPVLGELGTVDAVGRSFGVLKFRPADAAADDPATDIAWPRTERAGGSGAYRDFEVDSDPGLPIEDDLSRRDFTVNAIAWDIARGELVDPFAGRSDLEQGIVRAVGDPRRRLSEDLSRLLRAIRFACRLGFDIEDSTWAAIRELAPRLNETRPAAEGGETRTVPFETVAKELAGSFAGDAPRAMRLLLGSGALHELLPEMEQMVGAEQSPRYHSEGDVWTHTVLALERAVSPEFAQFFGVDGPSVETLLAVALHDVGKPSTATRDIDGHVSFHGHDVVGAELTRALADRLRLSSVAGPTLRPDRLSWLVRWHMFPLLVDLDHVRRTRLVRTFLDCPEAGQQLLQLSYCDRLASIPAGGEPSLDGLVRLMNELKELSERTVSEVRWLLSGDQVMEILGLEPGPEVGRIVDDLHEAQLSGEIYDRDSAREFLLRLPRE
ncbi:MAG: HD domain-containing protein [bacterium]